METYTHISNRNENFTDTSSGSFEVKLLSNRTLPVVVLTMNPRIYPKIVPIVVATQTLLTPEMKEVVADAACGSTWVNRTQRQFIITGIDVSTPGDVFNAVSVKHDP